MSADTVLRLFERSHLPERGPARGPMRQGTGPGPGGRLPPGAADGRRHHRRQHAGPRQRVSRHAAAARAARDSGRASRALPVPHTDGVGACAARAGGRGQRGQSPVPGGAARSHGPQRALRRKRPRGAAGGAGASFRHRADGRAHAGDGRHRSHRGDPPTRRSSGRAADRGTHRGCLCRHAHALPVGRHGRRAGQAAGAARTRGLVPALLRHAAAPSSGRVARGPDHRRGRWRCSIRRCWRV